MAINIPIGLSITDLTANFKTASSAVDSFTSQFKAQFDGLKGSADAPLGALNSISRQLTITKRQIGDLIAVGAPIPTELASKFTLLKGAVEGTKSAFNTPIQLAPYAALNQRLAETKNQIQDLRTSGEPVPAELTQLFRTLESQVGRVNREFDKIPTQSDKLRSLGGSLTSIGRPLSILSAGIGLLSAVSFKNYGDIDGIQRALTVTAGSTQEANKQFKEFVQLSKLPGLGLQEVVQAGLSLETLGYKAQTAEKYVSEVGNAIALGGKGKVEFGQVITQFTQMAGKAKVLGDDLKPIVNASPVIAKAINDMFGTIDSEQISAKLQAVGRGPKDFIEDLVANLSKLERVKGGPKNAVENFGDAVKLAQFQVASAADKVFGLTGKIEGLGNFVGRAAEGFGNLNPFLQGTILGMVGLAAAAGPVALGLGGVLNIAASLKAGTGTLALGLNGLQAAFAFLTGPIGLTVAAIAALGYAVHSIVSFNKEVTSSVSIAGEMNSAYKASTAAIAGEQTQLNALVAVAKNENLSKQTRLSAIKQINQVSPKYLGDISLETINTQKATNALAQYVRVMELKARAQIYQNRAAEAGVKISDIQAKKTGDFVDTGDVGAAIIQGGINKLVGGPTKEELLLKKAQDRKAQALKDAETVLKTSQIGLQSAVDQLARSGETITLTAPGFNYKAPGLGGDSELKQAKDRLKTLKEQIFAGNKAGQDTSALQAEYKATKARIDELNQSLGKQKVAHEAVGSALTTNERLLKQLSQRAKEQGDKAPESLLQEVAALQRAVDLDKARLAMAKIPRTTITGVEESGTVTVTPRVPEALGIGLNPVVYQKTNAQVSAIVGNVERLKELHPEAFKSTDIKQYLSAFALAGPSLDAYRNKIEEIKDNIATMTLNNVKVPPELLNQLKELKKGLADAYAGAGAADYATNSGPGGDVDAKFLEKAQDRIAKMKAAGKDYKGTAQDLAGDMKVAAIELANASFGVLEAIGGAFGAGENPLKAALKSITDALGNFLIKQGEALALAALFGQAAAAAAGPFAFLLSVPTGFQLAASAVMITGGAALKSFGGSFEGGGLFRGESFIRVGESARAVSGGGEFVAPVALGADLIADRIMRNLSLNTDKTPDPSRYGAPNQHSMSIDGEFVIRGRDLAYVLDQHSESQKYLT